MPLAERIAAVATDVDSKRDEYRSIDPYKMMSLLGISDASRPGRDWKFVCYVDAADLHTLTLREELGVLEKDVTRERYKELRSMIEDEELERTHKGRYGIFTEDEREKITELRIDGSFSTFRACAGNFRYCSNRYRIAALQQTAEFPSPQTWGYVVTGRFENREETWPS
jgi:hypothetical protein